MTEKEQLAMQAAVEAAVQKTVAGSLPTKETLENIIKMAVDAAHPKQTCPLGLSEINVDSLKKLTPENIIFLCEICRLSDSDFFKIGKEMQEAYKAGKSAVLVWFFRLLLLAVLVLALQHIIGPDSPVWGKLLQ